MTAVNGKQGLEVLAREQINLVFLDYMMPVLDGAGLLRTMKVDETLHDIPVVMMSSLPEATVAERCAGYAAFLRKPFRIVDVLALAERLIAKPTSPPA
ncbi:MAG TPA: response regulator, partial [Acidisoma sp.]|nr:response regulator [Acidisoma sp.]